MPIIFFVSGSWNNNDTPIKRSWESSLLNSSNRRRTSNRQLLPWPLRLSLRPKLRHLRLLPQSHTSTNPSMHPLAHQRHLGSVRSARKTYRPLIPHERHIPRILRKIHKIFCQWGRYFDGQLLIMISSKSPERGSQRFFCFVVCSLILSGRIFPFRLCDWCFCSCQWVLENKICLLIALPCCLSFVWDRGLSVIFFGICDKHAFNAVDWLMLITMKIVRVEGTFGISVWGVW